MLLTELDRDPDRWDAKAYLRQYYSTEHLASDDRGTLPVVERWLRNQPYGQRALDIGCGPVPFRAVLVLDRVKELHLVDFHQSNLDEIQLWLDDLPGAFDWDMFLRETLQLSHQDSSPASVEHAKSRIRATIKTLSRGDLVQSPPTANCQLPTAFELVTSYYSTACLATTRAGWESAVHNLASFVAPGGRLCIIDVRNCTHYDVFGERFSCQPINEHDWSALLPRLGFGPAKLEITPVTSGDFKDQGFEGVCVVCGVKTG